MDRNIQKYCESTLEWICREEYGVNIKVSIITFPVPQRLSNIEVVLLGNMVNIKVVDGNMEQNVMLHGIKFYAHTDIDAVFRQATIEINNMKTLIYNWDDIYKRWIWAVSDMSHLAHEIPPLTDESEGSEQR